jgi:hypothetical protein
VKVLEEDVEVPSSLLLVAKVGKSEEAVDLEDVFVMSILLDDFE